MATVDGIVKPSADKRPISVTGDSHIARFMARHGFKSQAELHAASVKDTAWFWDAAMKDMGVEWSKPYTQVKDDSQGFPWTKWFIGGEVNIAHNCVDRHVRDGHGGETAIFYEPDSGRPEDRRQLTFAGLKDQVDRCAGALRAMESAPSVLLRPVLVVGSCAIGLSVRLGSLRVPAWISPKSF